MAEVEAIAKPAQVNLLTVGPLGMIGPDET
jgi:hypothetical protein